MTDAVDHAQFERVGAKCDDRMTVVRSGAELQRRKNGEPLWALRLRPEEETELNDGPRRPVGALLSHPAGSLESREKAAAAPVLTPAD